MFTFLILYYILSSVICFSLLFFSKHSSFLTSIFISVLTGWLYCIIFIIYIFFVILVKLSVFMDDLRDGVITIDMIKDKFTPTNLKEDIYYKDALNEVDQLLKNDIEFKNKKELTENIYSNCYINLL